MALSETDYELLEGYLDGELEDGGREAVRARLNDDAAFAGALGQLRGERAMRQAMFAVLEPSDVEVERLVSDVRAGIARRRRVAGVFRIGRYVGSAAACFLGGFLVHAAFFGDAGREQPRQMGQPVTDYGATVRAVETYEVTLRDDSGNVVAVQRFDSLAKAQEFANDLSQWQRRAERLASGQFVVRAQRL